MSLLMYLVEEHFSDGSRKSYTNDLYDIHKKLNLIIYKNPMPNYLFE